MRFADSLLKEGDTIENHKKVIEREGAVWFGKMGSPVSQNHIDNLNIQVKEKIPSYIYLVKGNRRKSTVYRCRLALASKTLLEDERHLVPAYYAKLGIPKYVKFWVKLTKIEYVEFSILGNMRVASSVLPIGETLSKSSSGHFIICEDNLYF